MTRTKVALALAACGAVALCSPAARGQEKVETLTLIETPAPQDQKTEIGEMRGEIQDIQRRLAELENSVQTLEAQGAPAAAGLVPPAPPAATPPPTSQWRELKEGMSMDEVRELLGPPGDVVRDEYNTHWYYPDRSDASGTVDFGDGGDVLNWTEPER